MDSMLILTTPKGTIYPMGVQDLHLQGLVSDSPVSAERIDDPCILVPSEEFGSQI